MAAKKAVAGRKASTAGYSKFRSRWWAFCEIDRQIRRGRPCSVKSLASDLEVDAAEFAPVHCFHARGTRHSIEWNHIDERYELADATWTMPNVHLGEQELLMLAVATRSMAPMMPAPFIDSLERLLGKLLDSLPPNVHEEMLRLRKRVDFVPAAVQSKGQEWVAPIIDAIRNQCTVEMSYWALSRDVLTQRKVDPYHLRHFAGVWYLVGYDHRTKQLPVFNLARIRSLTTTDDSFRPKPFDVERYFQNCFGITAGGEPKTIRVRLTGRTARTAGERVWPAGFAYAPGGPAEGVLEGQVGKLDDLLAWVASCNGDAEVLPE